MTDQSISDTLYKAADLIEERGWTIGDGWMSPAGQPLCVEGALMAASGMDNAEGFFALPECSAYRAMRDYVGRVPFGWNDALPWTEDDDGEEVYRGGSREVAMEYGRREVIEALRACAVIEAAKESPALELAAPVAAVGSAG